MAQIEIYTKSTCSFCHAAKKLLKSKNLSFIETDILQKPNKRPEMIKRAGGRTTVPQIFINGSHVGGFDDLAVAEQTGKLDRLLAA